jgi:cation diffusion facilitator family transporter
VRAAHGKLAAWFGIITNFLIAGMKLTVAIILAAQDNWVFPMALIADAVNNFSDMGSSFVTLVGFKMASKPADKEHPFGHERIEYIAGLIVALIVVVLAVELFRDSLTKVIGDHHHFLTTSRHYHPWGVRRLETLPILCESRLRKGD